jgi:signal transduction histidine kinase
MAAARSRRIARLSLMRNIIPYNFSLRGLTPQLFVLVVFPLTLLMLIITFGGIRLHQLSMRGLVGERDTRSARAAASILSEQIKHRQSAIRGMALRSSHSAEEGLSSLLQDSSFLLQEFDIGLAFFNPQHDLLAFTGANSFWQGLELKSIFAQKKEIENGAAVIIFTIEDPENKSPVMLVVASPQPDGVITVGAFSLAELIEAALIDIVNPLVGGYASVIDQDGRVLYQIGSPAESEGELPDHPGVAEALKGNSGSTYLSLGAEEHVVAYSPIDTLGWALIIEEPWEVVTSPLLRATEYAPLVLIPVLILALVALWFVTNRIVQPLRSLEQKASALGWGDYESIEIPVGGVAEIQHLQTELTYLARKVKAAQQSLRGYIGVMTHGQEEERRRLARELHDDTLQSLIALNQRIQIARLSLNGTSELEGLDEIQQLSEDSIQELRRVTRALRPIYLEELGLVAALEMLARETQQVHGIETHFQQSGTERRMTPDAELALYRMAQEALSNVVRHAFASSAEIHLSYLPDQVILLVQDDGIGFIVPDSPSAFAPSGHYGLLGLHERAELLGAKLNITSGVDQGTRISVRFLVNPNKSLT